MEAGKTTDRLLSTQRSDQGFPIYFSLLATSLRLRFRTEPGNNLGMSFACFRFCYLRKIQLQPVENCLPELFPERWIFGRLNNRMAEIKILFRRKDAQIGANAETADRLRDNRSTLFKSNTIRFYRPDL